MTLEKPPSDDDKHAFLMAAAHHRPDDLLRYLNQYGTTIINHTDRDNWTALMFLSAYSSDIEAVRLLLEKGADPHMQSRSNNTAAALARKHGHPEIASFIEQWIQVQQHRQAQIDISKRSIDLFKKIRPAKSPFKRVMP